MRREAAREWTAQLCRRLLPGEPDAYAAFLHLVWSNCPAGGTLVDLGCGEECYLTCMGERAAEMMAQFKLADRAKDRAKSLSGGMQRRLSIAMALITEPKVLFLDEPTLGLDVRARRELWSHIEALKGKITMVVTTHYLEEAEKYADRIAIMEAGRIVALGDAQEIVSVSGKENFEEAFLSYTTEVE